MMLTATPVRKPVITDCETKRVYRPSRKMPASSIAIPATIVSRNSAPGRSAELTPDSADPAASAAAPVVVTTMRWVLLDTPPTNTTKAVEIGSSFPPTFNGVEVVPAPGPKGTKYVLGFNLKATLLNKRDFVVRARLGPFPAGLLAEVRFTDGLVFRKTASGEVPIGGLQYAANDPLVILFSVDFAANQYSVFLSAPAGPTSANNQSLLASGAGSNEPYFQVGFDGDASGQPPGIFVADDFVVSKTGP